MDQYNHPVQNSYPSPLGNGEDADHRRSKSKTYRNLIQFASCLLGLLVILVFALDSLGSAFQDAATNLIGGHGANPGTPAISLDLARGFIVFVVIVAFSGFWVSRELVLAKKVVRTLQEARPACPPTDSPSAAVVTPSESETQLARVQKQLDQQRTVLKKIQSQMYEDNVRPRHDFVSFRALYIVGADGDIHVEKEIVLTSHQLEVHFWRFYANGEQFAHPLSDETEMDLEVRALDDRRTECIPLLVDNKPTRKEFTVNFLPAITPGTQRAFLLKYKWPGFLRELITTGQTNYFWDSKAFTSGGIADFAVEWRFDPIYGSVQCETTRAHPSGMSLDKTQRHPGSKWVYAGSGIPLGNLPLELSFACDTMERT